MIAFGDSITVGVGATAPQLSWFNQLTTNKAVSGNQAADVSKAVQQIAPVSGDKFTVVVGVNDHRTYRNDPMKQEFFKGFLRQALAWLSLPTKIKARDAAMSYSGTWANTVANTFGKNSTQLGAKACATVSGNRVFVSYIVQNHAAAGGIAEVWIDGAMVGTLNSFGAMNTVNGASFAPACASFSVPDGVHNVEVKLINSGKLFYLDYIAGNADALQSPVKLGSIIRMSPAAYALHVTSDANVVAYNAIISQVASEFGIVPIDLFSAIDPANHLADG
ncbi:MAG: SGNH/GDSL hydrolase family protein, partial [Shewanella sp.]